DHRTGRRATHAYAQSDVRPPPGGWCPGGTLPPAHQAPRGASYLMVVPLTSRSGSGVHPDLSTDALVELYRQMVIIRRTEEQLARAHQQGLVHGACHT